MFVPGAEHFGAGRNGGSDDVIIVWVVRHDTNNIFFGEFDHTPANEQGP